MPMCPLALTLVHTALCSLRLVSLFFQFSLKPTDGFDKVKITKKGRFSNAGLIAPINGATWIPFLTRIVAHFQSQQVRKVKKRRMNEEKRETDRQSRKVEKEGRRTAKSEWNFKEKIIKGLLIISRKKKAEKNE